MTIPSSTPKSLTISRLVPLPLPLSLPRLPVRPARLSTRNVLARKNLDELLHLFRLNALFIARIFRGE